MQHEAELLIRLAAAFLLAGVLGWERESAGKPAGLRTHMLVGVASCLFVLLGVTAATDFPGNPETIRIEPLSLIQAVAVGIGFLGSGVVRVAAEESRPQGLTTAASIWATAAVGMGIGFGRYVLAVGATVLLLVALRGIARLEDRARSRSS